MAMGVASARISWRVWVVTRVALAAETGVVRVLMGGAEGSPEDTARTPVAGPERTSGAPRSGRPTSTEGWGYWPAGGAAGGVPIEGWPSACGWPSGGLSGSIPSRSMMATVRSGTRSLA